MNRQFQKPMSASGTSRLRAMESGFSLLELMVAMAMFMIIGAAAMSLIKANLPMASSQANQAGLTMNLRNALSQIELDAVNAGSGYYPGSTINAWPVGVTINNAPEGTACNTPSTYTYGANCFDTLNIIIPDANVPPLHPSAIVDTSGTGTGTVSLVATTATAPGLASQFHNGDELLWLTAGGGQLTTTKLTADGVANGANVVLTYTQTTSAGINAGDPYLIASGGDVNYANITVLTSSFGTGDWVLRLNPVTYKVDLTDPTNPKLVRQQGTGTPDVVAEQIIGFRVGASIRLGGCASDTIYNFNASAPPGGCTSGSGYNNDWAQVRAVRVSIIGRTPPNSEISTNFRNNFDQGAYKIQGLSVTINPRNLSMVDQ